MVLVKTDENGVQIPHRPKHEEATLELHPVPGKGLIVKVEPPREPSIPTEHVPCDIVLVIDVSGSMIADAPIPTKPGEKAENNGLSVLDLVKHAARTIVETLNENDRLAIVTFASSSTVLQNLLPMTQENKKQTDESIESMTPKDATNLWHAIRDGLRIFSHDGYEDRPKRMPAMMVLTDGCPNHMCPTQGYVPKLKSMGKLPAIINTFGFGYSLRSGLLKSIAEISGGSYAFIPDAGMVGTVFIHAVANLQSTFARNATLKLTYPSNIIEPSRQADQEPAFKLTPNHPLGKNYSELVVHLHNLQYGQTRDIFLEYSSWKSSPITATLTYQRLDQHPETLPQAILYPSAPPPLPTYTPAEAAYHISRSKIVSYLLGLSPPSDFDEERTPILPLPQDISTELATFIESLPCNTPEDTEISSHPLNKSLMQDLTGQISLAITNPEYYARWGVHYLPSLADAHSKQTCNSFKDPGPLMYGTDSPLFKQCRDRLDSAFDDLPPPKPSNLTFAMRQAMKKSRPAATGLGMGFSVQEADRYRRTRSNSNETTTTGGVATPASTAAATPTLTQAESGANYWADFDWRDFKMSSYNSRDNPCFAGCVRVLLAGDYADNGKVPLTPVEETMYRGDEQFPWLENEEDTHSTRGRSIKISKLRAGMQVSTPRGPRRVVAVLKTAVRKQEMCLVGKKGLLVTPWHPVSLPTTTSGSSSRPAGSWTFPRDVSRRKVRYTGSIYSVLLERDADPDAHAVFVGGVWGVTLGHGLITPTASSTRTSSQAMMRVDVDVRAHPFFGDYGAVVRSLGGLHRNSNGLVLGGGVKRDVRTGLVDGFRRLSGEELRMVVDEMMGHGGGKAAGSRARVQKSSHAAARHGGGSSRAETCMWRRTVGCV